MVVSSIGTREDALDLADRLAAYAKAWRRRTVVVGEEGEGDAKKAIRQPAPLDADAHILDQIAVDLALVATAPGDWPHGLLSRGRVLVWASSLLSVVHHVESQTGNELQASVGFLRRTAAELQGHATGLRPTGTWAVAGEMEAPDRPAPEPDAPPSEEPDEDAITAKIYPVKPRADP